MLNIFYQKNTLDDTLIINVSSNKANKIVIEDNARIGYFNDKLVFANIFNASKNIKNLKDGLLFPTKELLNNLEKILKINLSSFFDNGFKVGLVEKCDEIKGTHLHKCVVDIKDKKLDIVCGAANCRLSLKVVVATNGTMLPNGKSIIAGTLLGNKSEGMLCSYKELNINKDSKGIVELDDNYQIGNYFKEVYANEK